LRHYAQKLWKKYLGRIIPFSKNSKGKFRFIYGDFNSLLIKNGSGIENVFDFPIPWENFKARFYNKTRRNNDIFTIKKLFSILSSMINSDKYWEPHIKNIKYFNRPSVKLLFSNRQVGDTIYFDIFFIDTKLGIPLTTLTLKGKKSLNSMEQAALKERIPVIRLGHSNSFIKNISLSHIIDESMKANLINKMYKNRVTNSRDPLTADVSLETTSKTPLTLPLQGEMETVGHIQWKPLRTFYLSSGMYLVDGIYFITSVTHTINSQGFFTKVGFRFN